MKSKVEESSSQDVKEKEKAQGDSDQEMLNLDNEIYSLTHYADDEEELVAQMFATIKGGKLEAMMPPILKEIPLIDVQQLCLHELRGMSQRRILSIINGQEMSGSSSEDSDEDKKHSKIQDENEDSNLGGKSLDDCDDLFTGKELQDLENVNDSNLTALDILELEMRAKLIKTMLEKDGDDGKEESTNGFVPDIKIKEEPLTPESTRMDDEPIIKKSPEKNRKRYSRSKKRRSDSRSYSSSSSSKYSYSSSRSGSSSRDRSYSSERRKDGSESPESSRKPTKKKITKKEFEARMKKAKMNRSYRKRKDSEDDSGENGKRDKRKSKKKGESKNKSSYSLKKTLIENSIVPPEEEEPPKEELEEAEEGEIMEKEEGEIDSNEEGACTSSEKLGSRSSRSRSRSRSYSSASYSSGSSRSRSYSKSPKRSKKSKKHRRSRSRSLSDVPKIPNWQPGNSNNKGKIGARLDVDNVNSEEDFDTKSETQRTLPSKDDRQSISFSIGKKSNAPVKTSSENNDGISAPVKEDDDSQDKMTETSDSRMESTALNSASQSSQEESISKGDKVLRKKASAVKIQPERISPVAEDTKHSPEEEIEPGEVVEDFYKGADQLSFSEEEGECEDEAELEKFLNDDTPVEPISVGDSILRKSVKVVSNKDEPPIVSWENKKKKERKGDLVMEGVGFIKTVLSEGQGNVDSPLEDSIDITKEYDGMEDISLHGSLPDIAEESNQDLLEPLPETEAEDSRDSHSLDIIGVIDPTDNQEKSFDEDIAGGGSSWSMRWLQSEKVQKVVSNSKMLSKVRKKIQAKGKAIVKEPPKILPKQPAVELKVDAPKIEVKPQTKSSSNVIGSIEEYEKLFGIKVKAPTSLPQPKPQTKSTCHATASLFNSDDDEDSEEEALWSKIMKK